VSDIKCVFHFYLVISFVRTIYFQRFFFEKLAEKEENENASSSYCCPYLAKVHQQTLLYPLRDKEKLVYTVSKIFFSNGPNRTCKNVVDFLFIFILLC
jgi:hypothetical protein